MAYGGGPTYLPLFLDVEALPRFVVCPPSPADLCYLFYSERTPNTTTASRVAACLTVASINGCDVSDILTAMLKNKCSIYTPVLDALKEAMAGNKSEAAKLLGQQALFVLYAPSFAQGLEIITDTLANKWPPCVRRASEKLLMYTVCGKAYLEATRLFRLAPSIIDAIKVLFETQNIIKRDVVGSPVYVRNSVTDPDDVCCDVMGSVLVRLERGEHFLLTDLVELQTKSLLKGQGLFQGTAWLFLEKFAPYNSVRYRLWTEWGFKLVKTDSKPVGDYQSFLKDFIEAIVKGRGGEALTVLSSWLKYYHRTQKGLPPDCYYKSLFKCAVKSYRESFLHFFGRSEECTNSWVEPKDINIYDHVGKLILIGDSTLLHMYEYSLYCDVLYGDEYTQLLLSTVAVNPLPKIQTKNFYEFTGPSNIEPILAKAIFAASKNTSFSYIETEITHATKAYNAEGYYSILEAVGLHLRLNIILSSADEAYRVFGCKNEFYPSIQIHLPDYTSTDIVVFYDNKLILQDDLAALSSLHSKELLSSILLNWVNVQLDENPACKPVSCEIKDVESRVYINIDEFVTAEDFEACEEDNDQNNNSVPVTKKAIDKLQICFESVCVENCQRFSPETAVLTAAEIISAQQETINELLLQKYSPNNSETDINLLVSDMREQLEAVQKKERRSTLHFEDANNNLKLLVDDQKQEIKNLKSHLDETKKSLDKVCNELIEVQEELNNIRPVNEELLKLKNDYANITLELETEIAKTNALQAKNAPDNTESASTDFLQLKEEYNRITFELELEKQSAKRNVLETQKTLNDIKTVKEELSQLQINHTKLKHELENEIAKTGVLNAERTYLETEHQTTKAKLHNITKQNTKLKEEHKKCTPLITELQLQLKEATGKLEDACEEIDCRQKTVVALKAQLADEKELNANLNLDAVKTQFEQTVEEYKEIAEKAIKRAKSLKETFRAKLKALDDRYTTTKAEAEKLRIDETKTLIRASLAEEKCFLLEEELKNIDEKAKQRKEELYPTPSELLEIEESYGKRLQMLLMSANDYLLTLQLSKPFPQYKLYFESIEPLVTTLFESLSVKEVITELINYTKVLDIKVKEERAELRRFKFYYSQLLRDADQAALCRNNHDCFIRMSSEILSTMCYKDKCLLQQAFRSSGLLHNIDG
ncbi:ORF89-like protein [Bufonid herpesvirus 1]|uniref:ORF89-like protein n=1 Tax=Bufonid herpesvirus 1 TaxID=2282206 RepID=UPI000EB6305C|nr:ORF89-like protein [Bufonid herpesvirus 1]AXF48541.1 ORF89-like protein [Bufonid herpesvirus 1]